jgi:L-rhamnose isomerase
MMALTEIKEKTKKFKIEVPSWGLENYEKLKQAQENHDVVEAEEILKEAYETE